MSLSGYRAEIVAKGRPVVLLDEAAPPASVQAAAFPPRTLFSSNAAGLVPGDKPGVPFVSGVTAPTWPRSLGTMSLSFSHGIYVQSCPANVTFTITA
jgi:hypothetical protein